ncbi:MAG: alanine dehydrogenase [Gemmatimonadota bacterium]|jgi:alanine dehydrogenase
MVIGVPREIHRQENRVGLSPFAVSQLVAEGHSVFVEKGAGVPAHFTDHDFEEAGAHVVYGPEEPYHRSDLVCRVGRPSTEELDLLKPGGTIIAFQHLAVIPKENVDRFMELETTLIGYEVITDETGDFPVLNPFSEMAGQMAIPLATHYLQTTKGGRGILIGNVPGVPPATVLIIGAGTVGTSAARSALGHGAHVLVVDDDLAKLRTLSREFMCRPHTVIATQERLARYSEIADVVVGAILVPGRRAPHLVTEEMVMRMKPGSVIIDVSVDQGGCVATTRPTTLDRPTFVQHGVVHYCVPNMTANVPRTASRVLTNAALPYVKALASKGLKDALLQDSALAGAVYTFEGKMVNQGLAEHFGLPFTPLMDLLN